jgi:hypothetical protein
MNVITKICGSLVALIWLAFSAYSLFGAYFLLTFSFGSPSLSENFQNSRFTIIGWSLAGPTYLVAAIGVLLRRRWGRGLSFFMGALACCFAAGQLFVEESSRLDLKACIVIAALSVSVLAWLFSRSASSYFGQVALPA